MAFLVEAAIHPMGLRKLLIFRALYAQVRFTAFIIIDVFGSYLASALALSIVRLHDTPPARRVAKGAFSVSRSPVESGLPSKASFSSCLLCAWRFAPPGASLDALFMAIIPESFPV